MSGLVLRLAELLQFVLVIFDKIRIGIVTMLAEESLQRFTVLHDKCRVRRALVGQPGDAGSESDVLGSCVALAFVNAKIPEDLF